MGDLGGISGEIVVATDVVCRKATAHVEHFQLDVIFFAQTIEDDLYFADSGIPGANVSLLRAYLEREALGFKS